MRRGPKGEETQEPVASLEPRKKVLEKEGGGVSMVECHTEES